MREKLSVHAAMKIVLAAEPTGGGVGRHVLDLAERLFPNPLEGNSPPFIKGRGESAEAAHHADVERPWKLGETPRPVCIGVADGATRRCANVE